MKILTFLLLSFLTAETFAKQCDLLCAHLDDRGQGFRISKLPGVGVDAETAFIDAREKCMAFDGKIKNPKEAWEQCKYPSLTDKQEIERLKAEVELLRKQLNACRNPQMQ